jgi:hypothetical protein
MFFIVKFFNEIIFQKKIIFLKIFSGIWLIRKNHQQCKIESDDVRPVLLESDLVWAEYGRNFQIPTLAWFWQQLPDSLATIAGIQRVPSDSYKCVCKNEKFNSRKRFMVFKTVNRFPKIKNAFRVKLKIISVDHDFRLHQTPKKCQKYFSKIILRWNK